MVCLQRFQRLSVHLVKVARVDERGVYALVGKHSHHVLALLIERSGCDNRHLLALVHYLIFSLVAILRIHGFFRVHHAVARHADGYRLPVLKYSPTHHGEVFLAGGRSQIHEVRDAAEHRDVEEADVRDVVHRVDTATHYVDDSRIAVDA